MKNIIVIIVLIVLLIGSIIFSLSTISDKIYYKNRAENFKELYEGLLGSSLSVEYDTITYYDTITHYNIIFQDSILYKDSIVIDTLPNIYLRAYSDSLINDNCKVHIKSFVNGYLVKNEWSYKNLVVDKTVNKIVYRDKIIKVPDNSWRYYGMVGYNFDRPSIGIMALSKGRLGLGYKNYFNDTHEFLILYKL